MVTVNNSTVIVVVGCGSRKTRVKGRALRLVREAKGLGSRPRSEHSVSPWSHLPYLAELLFIYKETLIIPNSQGC
jgi:hypothetical protein